MDFFFQNTYEVSKGRQYLGYYIFNEYFMEISETIFIDFLNN